MTTPPWIEIKHDQRCPQHEDKPSGAPDCLCKELASQDYENHILDKYGL